MIKLKSIELSSPILPPGAKQMDLSKRKLREEDGYGIEYHPELLLVKITKGPDSKTIFVSACIECEPYWPDAAPKVNKFAPKKTKLAVVPDPA